MEPFKISLESLPVEITHIRFLAFIRVYLFTVIFYIKCFNPKSTGLFPLGAALVFHPPPLCKIRSRHPRKLKFTGLIAYVMFYKICKFGSLTIINDVIMTSLPKAMGKCGILH